MSQAPRSRVVSVFALLTLWLVVAVVTGCDLTSLSPSLSPSSSPGNGTVKLLVTDGPFPFDLIDKATVTITKIEVRKAPASQPAEEESGESQADGHDQDPNPATDQMQEETHYSATAKYQKHTEGDQEEGDTQSPASQPSDDGERTDGDHGAPCTQPGGDGANAPSSQPGDDGENADWVVIFEGQKEFNLLDLRNGRTDLLANTTIPAGTYSEMRLIVTQGTVTLKDGREFKLKIPSGAHSGIKLHFTFTVGEGQEKQLLLDVNLSRAFKVIPGGAIKHAKDIRGFMFRPCLGARLINIVQAGSIGGLVTDTSQAPLANVTVTALRDGQEVASTSTDVDGTYSLVGLTTGTYTVTFSAEGYVETQVADVAVTAGQATENVNAALETAAPASQPGT